jgi:hypothetical protein
MLKQKKFTHWMQFTPKADKPKERERMSEALAAYQGPIIKCPPGSARDRALSASSRVAKSRPPS